MSRKQFVCGGFIVMEQSKPDKNNIVHQHKRCLKCGFIYNIHEQVKFCIKASLLEESKQ